MILDVRTLGILSAMVPLVLGFIMSIYWWERRTYGGFGRWVLANFVFSVGYILVTLRGYIPDIFSIILGNAAIVYTEILIFEGIRLFYGLPAFSKWNSFIFILYLLLHVFFAYLSPNINARIAIISITLFALVFRSGVSLINNPLLELRPTTRNAGIIFLITSTFLLTRAIYALAHPEPIDMFTDEQSPWFALLSLLLVLTWTFYFFLVNSARLELDLENARTELMKLAMTDPLTGLYNRRHFFERAEIEFQRALRHESSLSFLLMDVDGFKFINDTYGHDAGDEVMQRLSAIFPAHVRIFDLVARFGGDEFIVMLVDVPEAQAYEIAERIREAVSQMPVIFDARNISIQLSLGIASFKIEDVDLMAVLKRADLALYEAKENGRNRVHSR